MGRKAFGGREFGRGENLNHRIHRARQRHEFLILLQQYGIQTMVDMRLRPDRASMGIWVMAKTADNRIKSWLTAAGMGYRSLVELDNVFRDFPHWRPHYEQLLASAGKLLTERLVGFPNSMCLLCSEKRLADCHQQQVASFRTVHRGVEIEHFE